MGGIGPLPPLSLLAIRHSLLAEQSRDHLSPLFPIPLFHISCFRFLALSFGLKPDPHMLRRQKEKEGETSDHTGI